jgi:hypothetical protein
VGVSSIHGFGAGLRSVDGTGEVGAIREPDPGLITTLASVVVLSQPPFQGILPQVSETPESEVGDQLERARHCGRCLRSAVNLRADFFEGALWARFESRRVAERYRRIERRRPYTCRSATGFLW